MNLVAGGNTDVVHSHFAGNVGKHLVSVFEFDTEHGVRQRFNDRAFNQNCVVLGLGQGAHHLGDNGLRFDIEHFDLVADGCCARTRRTDDKPKGQATRAFSATTNPSAGLFSWEREYFGTVVGDGDGLFEMNAS